MINDIILVMLSYLVVILIGLIIMAWFLAGFFFPFIRVKLSRGRLVLVKIIKNTATDWTTGEEIENQLVFKYHKEVMRISNYKDGFYRAFNVNVIDLDPEKWGVLKRDYKGVSGHSPSNVDSLITRALMRPDKAKTREMIIILLLIVGLIGIGFIAYKLTFIEKVLSALQTVGGANL